MFPFVNDVKSIYEICQTSTCAEDVPRPIINVVERFLLKAFERKLNEDRKYSVVDVIADISTKTNVLIHSNLLKDILKSNKYIVYDNGFVITKSRYEPDRFDWHFGREMDDHKIMLFSGDVVYITEETPSCDGSFVAGVSKVYNQGRTWYDNIETSLQFNTGVVSFSKKSHVGFNVRMCFFDYNVVDFCARISALKRMGVFSGVEWSDTTGRYLL